LIIGLQSKGAELHSESVGHCWGDGMLGIIRLPAQADISYAAKSEPST
jgi:hypothetical protein